jgi:dGTPase
MNWISLLSHKRLGAEHKFVPTSGLPQTRSEFEVDFDRIIFSYPFRRLQDKTQVVPLPEYDFVHTRLTHSLEVSSVGRSLGKLAGQYILDTHPHLKELGYTHFDFGAIVAAASLAHDIGNPPFGHAGEKALSEYFNTVNPDPITDKEYFDLQNFEGNAQGFRILCDPMYQDLKLTYASIGAFAKYPCESLVADKDPGRKSQKKYGFYQSEKEVFKTIATELELQSLSTRDITYNRHPLVYLVEAADDICYLIIDLEDAYRMKVISYTQFVDMVAPLLGNHFDRAKLNRMKDEGQQIGLLRALAINQLVNECAQLFNENEPGILQGSFDKALSDMVPSQTYTKQIGQYSFEHIYNSQKVLEIQAAGFEVLPGLMEIFIDALEDYYAHKNKGAAKNINIVRMLPKHITDVEFLDSSTFYTRSRKILDFVSGLTDKYAVSLYRKLKGIQF